MMHGSLPLDSVYVSQWFNYTFCPFEIGLEIAFRFVYKVFLCGSYCQVQCTIKKIACYSRDAGRELYL